MRKLFIYDENATSIMLVSFTKHVASPLIDYNKNLSPTKDV